jgi:hypothetical protein
LQIGGVKVAVFFGEGCLKVAIWWGLKSMRYDRKIRTDIPDFPERFAILGILMKLYVLKKH